MGEELSKIDVFSSDRLALNLLRRIWELESTAETVRRLLQEYSEGASTGPLTDLVWEPSNEVVVRAHYEGVEVEGVFDRATGRLRITSGELAGRTYRSPSGAAAAVVGTINKDVHPNRNGWTFWTVAGTGHLLQSIRHAS